MEFNTRTQDISVRETAYAGGAEQAVDSDITLPEYFPDIVRVLKCELKPNIASVKTAGDRITADGTGVLCVLYISDDQKLHCFEQNIPFTKFVETKAAENGGAVSARAKTEYVNCRVVNPRRVDIHGSISLHFAVDIRKTQKILSACDGAGVETRSRKINICNLLSCDEKAFTLNETLEIGAGKSSIAQLVRSEAVAVIEDTKLVSGKILIKGELFVKTLYIADSTDGALQRIEHSMPISQIIEVDSNEDDCTDYVRLFVSELTVAAKTDASGALRLLEINASVRAAAEIYKTAETTAVIEAYSTKFALEEKAAGVDIRNLSEILNDTFLCRGSLDLSGSNVAAVLDAACAGITQNTAVRAGELTVNGTVTLNLLIADTAGQISFTQRQFEYEYKHGIASSAERLSCEPTLAVTGVNFLLGAEDKIDARVEADISAAVFEVETLKVLTEIKVDETKPKSVKTASLTIYFAEAGESVWSIAKRYNTTVRAVMQENRLSDDILQENCKLLIPRV